VVEMVEECAQETFEKGHGMLGNKTRV